MAFADFPAAVESRVAAGLLPRAQEADAGRKDLAAA